MSRCSGASANSGTRRVAASIVERRYAQGNADRFQEFADEMVRLNVNVIIVVTTPAAQAAKRATTTIPIVHPAVIDPVGTGLVASLARPGGNLTRLAIPNAELTAKRLDGREAR